jgi:hypothetical protein
MTRKLSLAVALGAFLALPSSAMAGHGLKAMARAAL